MLATDEPSATILQCFRVHNGDGKSCVPRNPSSVQACLDAACIYSLQPSKTSSTTSSAKQVLVGVDVWADKDLNEA